MRRFARFCVAIGMFAAGLAPAAAAESDLVSAARKEGRVVWYTTLILDQLVRPIVGAFEKKYGIKVDYVRLDPDEIARRILDEGASHHLQADVFDGFSEVVPLSQKNLVAHWIPDAARAWPAAYSAADKTWVATNLYVLTPAFNTDLAPRGTEPKTYEDLLDPKWKGRMAWSSNPSTSGAAGFIGRTLLQMGQERGMDYLRRLATQRVTGVRASARAVLDQTISGEYAIALQIFDYHATISAGLGAPVDWIKMQPALAAFGVASMTQPAPHPAAAKLLLDFLTSPEGQGVFRDANYIPVAPDVPPRDPRWRPDGSTFKAINLTPDQIQAFIPVWAKIYDQLFR